MDAQRTPAAEKPRFDRHAAASRATSKAAQQRKDRMLEGLAKGMTVGEACEYAGWAAKNSYHRARARDPAFGIRCDQVRGNLSGEDEPWDGTSVDFDLKFIPSPEESDGPTELGVTQREIYRVLDTAPEGEIVMVLVAPGSRKTTTLENWAVQKVARDPNHRVMLISESTMHARKSIGRCKQLLTDYEIAPGLIARFGPFYQDGQEKHGKPWASDHFTVWKRRGGLRDFTMQAYGLTSQIYGSRADTIIIDDPQSRKTLSQTKEMLERLRLEVFTRRPTGRSKTGGLRGRIVIIATRIDVGDVYETLIDEGVIKPENLIRLPVVDTDGAPLDPIVFPPESIDELRAQVGERAWSAAYMQRPAAGENATFDEESIERAQRLGSEAFVGEIPSGWSVAIGVDPNLGSGYTAMAALAFRAHEARLVDVAERFGLARTEDILDMLARFCATLKPNYVQIENNAFQRGLVKDDRMREMARRYGFIPAGHRTGFNKADDQIGVAMMGSSFVHGRIVIPSGDDFARTRFDPLCQELRAWRPNVRGRDLKQDLVMALWFAWLKWQQLMPQDGINDQQWTTRGWVATPYKPLTAAV